MTSFGSHVTRGLLAGAAGTTALNAATYIDMVVRGRPASSTPEKTVGQMAERSGASIPGDETTEQARTSGLGALLGIAAGVGSGALLGALRAAGWPRSWMSTATVAWALATLAGNAPMVGMGVVDPRQWKPADWAADLVPHGVYAIVTATALEQSRR